MRTIQLTDLIRVLARPSFLPRDGARIHVSHEPKPFVAPTLEIPDENRAHDPLGAEILLISAPAAVGKSTVAKYLSSQVQAPLLNLSTTPVSTHSLVGLLKSDFEGVGDPLSAFHKGKLPFIIDSLDEGRLLTGEKGFEEFLLTTAELLARDRSASNRPKLVVFGRLDSSSFAEVALSYFDQNIVSRLEISFFDKDLATEVIRLYANLNSADKSDVLALDPAKRAVAAYFEAIESALSLGSGLLWDSDLGRAFAGYAPVLATLGEAVGRESNYQSLENRLRSQSSTGGDAWDVIAEVISLMLSRESEQLRSKLKISTQDRDLGSLYDESEQLDFLAYWLSGKSVRGTRRTPLSGENAEAYYTLVEQKLPEHPFIDAEQKSPRNSVFGAAVLANAIFGGLDLGRNATGFFEESARQPFLWRFFETSMAADTLISGTDVGYLLSSLWSDPLRTGATISVRPSGPDSVEVRLEGPSPMQFQATTPVCLYSGSRAVDAKIDGGLILVGAASHGGRSVFSFLGRNSLNATSLRVEADELVVEGHTWLEADTVDQKQRLQLQVKPGTEYGWGKAVRDTYPWSAYRSTLLPPPPIGSAAAPHIRIIRAFSQHLSGAQKPFYVGVQYGALDAHVYGERASWMARDFGAELPIFVRTIVQHGLASAEPVSGAKASRLRVSVSVSWDELLRAAIDPSSAEGPLRAFIEELKDKL